jgi:hypothetical protein
MDNIKIGREGRACEDMDWTDLAQDKDSWPTV